MKKKMTKLKSEFTEITYFFNKKQSLLIYLILILGVIVPAFSGISNYNLWYRIHFILTNPFYNCLFFLAIAINMIYLLSDFTKRYEILCRYHNYSQIIKLFIKKICNFTIYLTLISLILVFAGSILFCMGEIDLIKHPVYNIYLIVYILFYIIRSIVFNCCVCSIIYLITIILKKYLSIILIIINTALYLLLSNSIEEINHFYNLHIMYHYYYFDIYYNNFVLEVICSLLEFFILYFVYKIIFIKVIQRKRELE